MRYKHWLVVLVALLLGACASSQADKRQRQAASLIEFLYPGKEAATPVAVANIA